MPINRPDQPIRPEQVQPEAHEEEEREERQDMGEEPDMVDEALNPDHPDRKAILRERSDGAHSEQVGDDANFREDESPPGS